MLLCAGIFIYWPQRPEKEVSKKRSLDIPDTFGEWTCVTKVRSSGATSSFDSHWSGECSKGPGERADLDIGYLSGQSWGRRLPSPALNFSGTRLRSEVLDLEAKGRSLHVRQIIGQRSTGQNEAILYWFELDDESFASEYPLRLALLLRKILGRETAGVSVRIGSPVTQANEGSVLERQRKLARDVWNYLSKH